MTPTSSKVTSGPVLPAQDPSASTEVDRPQPLHDERTGHESGNQQHEQGQGRKMVGRVVSAKMQKTVVVEVVNHRRDPLYGKYVRSRSRYKAHDKKGELKAGDEVEIQEHRPISREKRFLVVRLIKKFVEE